MAPLHPGLGSSVAKGAIDELGLVSQLLDWCDEARIWLIFDLTWRLRLSDDGIILVVAVDECQVLLCFFSTYVEAYDWLTSCHI